MRVRTTAALFVAVLVIASAWTGHESSACAQDPGAAARIIEFHFVPTRRAQIALWVESADGSIFKTIRLTKSVAYYGIGNRPGALQMNSGFRWPYGRREGVLPLWAHRRVAHGGMPFRRVIFQDRISEGHASRSSADASVDRYFCLSFNASTTTRETLFNVDDVDAVSCASVFNSDKGRYLTGDDMARGYAEPEEEPVGAGMMAPLSLESLYPPRRDVVRCTSTGCNDHPDVDLYQGDARRVMPDIDAITSATPHGGTDPRLPPFVVPAAWPDGDYVAWLEINVEGDYNGTYNDHTYPTPATPTDKWDYWALTYGYPYRGQPSVVYRLPFVLGPAGEFHTSTPAGYGSLSGKGTDGGEMHAMDDRITDNPIDAPGSGADRLLRAASGQRFQLIARDAEYCVTNEPPGDIEQLSISPDDDEKHSHEYARLRFIVPEDNEPIYNYEVRVGTEPIVDLDSFMRAVPANAASHESEELMVPTDNEAGDVVEVDFGGLMPSTHYYVAMRATDLCGASSDIATGEVVTTAINFTTVSPCFVATAAYGTPMASEIGALRRLRDRHMMTNAPGRALVAAYYEIGPSLADAIRAHETLRAAARVALAPLVSLARWLED